MDVLKSVRQAIAAEYRDYLGQQLNDWIPGVDAPTGGPSWSYVDSVLLDTHQADVKSAFGLVIDDEVSTLLYVVPFTPDTACDPIINRALALQSRLLPEANYESIPSSKRDVYGPWTVAVLWLVDEKHKHQWTQQIVERRRSSGFAEELSNDIFEYTEESFKLRLRDHHFPQLLLQTRASLKRDNEASERWLSVDAQIAQALEGFHESFASEGERQIADRIMSRFEEARSAATRREPQARSETPSIKTIEIKDFRSIRNLNLVLRPQGKDRDAIATVIHGPNGSGKSTVFEALSIALTGTSTRHVQFLADRDVERMQREYLSYALSPLGSDVSPAIRVNDGPNLCDNLSQDNLDARLTLFDGCLLSQADTAKFGLLSAEELGLQVLSGYSIASEELRQFVDVSIAQSNADWQSLLRSFGIRASVTKRETYIGKISEIAVQRDIASSSDDIVDLLQRTANYGGALAKRASGVLKQWTDASGKSVQEDLVNRISKAALRGNEKLLNQEIQSALAARNKAAAALRTWLDDVTRFVAPWKGELIQLEKDLRSWALWLEKTRSVSRGANKAIDSLRAEMDALAKQQQDVVKQGREVRTLIDHLLAIDTFVSDWSRSHPAECPTCGSDHSNAGGIRNVVEQRAKDLNRRREELASQYKRLEDAIAGIRKNLEALGEIECPVSQERRKDLSSTLAMLVGAGDALEKTVLAAGSVDLFAQTLHALISAPAAPPEVEATSLAKETALRIAKAIEDADRKRLGPEQWRSVKSELDKRLGRIVEEHLPKTVERLWVELVSYLTAARWIMPERPKMKIEQRKGQQAVTVRIVAGQRSPLARYILNQSETHILGLAWFISRFITHGRFKSDVIVLDDPAQDMDQPTYRGLCRLLGKMMRLQKMKNESFSLVVMLHQEDRALDLTRETNAALVILGWQRTQSDIDDQPTVRTMRLLTDNFAPIPGRTLFMRPADAAVSKV